MMTKKHSGMLAIAVQECSKRLQMRLGRGYAFVPWSLCTGAMPLIANNPGAAAVRIATAIVWALQDGRQVACSLDRL